MSNYKRKLRLRLMKAGHIITDKSGDINSKDNNEVCSWTNLEAFLLLIMISVRIGQKWSYIIYSHLSNVWNRVCVRIPSRMSMKTSFNRGQNPDIGLKVWYSFFCFWSVCFISSAHFNYCAVTCKTASCIIIFICLRWFGAIRLMLCRLPWLTKPA